MAILQPSFTAKVSGGQAPVNAANARRSLVVLARARGAEIGESLARRQQLDVAVGAFTRIV